MWRLGIDTSGPTAFVAVVGPGGEFERARACAGAQSEELSVLVGETFAAAGIQPTDIGEVCVGLGPGSFTGLRIGLSFAKGFAQARAIPLVGASSLAAYTYAARDLAENAIAVSDAGRGDLFWCVFHEQAGWRRRTPDALSTISQVQQFVAELPSAARLAVVGEEACPIGLARRAPERVAVGILALSAAGSAEAVRGELAELQPNYLRVVSARTVAERQAAPKTS